MFEASENMRLLC